MDADDLLMKEYEFVAKRCDQATEGLSKTLNMFTTINVVLITLFFRGDLPEKTLLVAAGVFIMSCAYLTGLSYKKSAMAGLARLTERKLEIHFGEKFPSILPFQFPQFSRTLKDGDKRTKILTRIHRYILFLGLVIIFFAMVHHGIHSHQPSPMLYWATMSISMSLVLGLCAWAWKQNQRLKRRYARLVREVEEKIVTGKYLEGND